MCTSTSVFIKKSAESRGIEFISGTAGSYRKNWYSPSKFWHLDPSNSDKLLLPQPKSRIDTCLLNFPRFKNFIYEQWA